MPAKIDIQPIDSTRFQVRVVEADSESRHQVTLKPEDCARLSLGKLKADELIRRSFEFLLQREPKESILARFDLTVISRYFPDYETEIQRELPR